MCMPVCDFIHIFTYIKQKIAVLIVVILKCQLTVTVLLKNL